jgi:hypothetical protein
MPKADWTEKTNQEVPNRSCELWKPCGPIFKKKKIYIPVSY